MCIGGCGGSKKRERWIVTYANGTQVPKSTEEAAKQAAAKSPGATYVKAS
jgi:hypothetical protein